MGLTKKITSSLKNLNNNLNSQNFKKIKKFKNEKNSEYFEGISVITPSFKGEKTILKLLESLKKQSLRYELFEHIIIINGELDETPNIIKNFKEKNPQMNIILKYSPIKSPSHSRNIGLESVTREYVTFIDDDDFISTNYLKEMLKKAEKDRIIISNIVDVDEDGNYLSSPINQQIIMQQGIVNQPYTQISMILTINACKLIPTKVIKKIRFDTNLSSGEDIVFFCKLISLYDFDFYILKPNKAIYYRLMKSNSVSRKQISYEFNVNERLSVIKELNNILLKTKDIDKAEFIKQKIRAQTSFINRYLQQYPNDYQKIHDTIKSFCFTYFSFQELNKKLAKTLIISYCFPPYVDTSANVMAKRVIDLNCVVDVIQNNMGKIRNIDNTLLNITNEFIENQMIIDSNPSFGDWKGIKEFCQKGMETLSKISRESEYTSIYSRAMFPASHFLAFEYKIKNPNTKWIAEFSDPILYDIKSNPRISKINDPEYLKKIRQILKNNGMPKYSNDNVFFLCEFLAYVFADEIIFTNSNQKKYMINEFPYKELSNIINLKATINEQPTLPKEFYYLVPTSFKLNTSYVNFAYFGSFYATRNLEDVYDAFEHINSIYQNKYRLYLFTSDVDGIKQTLSHLSIKNNIIVNDYVTFLEFLNLATKFQCLIVNDTCTKKYKELNPYLPSKLSDYIGSGTDIWGICEENSIMSQYDLNYKSFLGNKFSNRQVVQEIINKHMG